MKSVTAFNRIHIVNLNLKLKFPWTKATPIHAVSPFIWKILPLEAIVLDTRQACAGNSATAANRHRNSL